MQIFTELKNGTDKVIVARFDSAELMFKPGETKDMAYFFPADIIPTILSRFQIKYGLTLVKESLVADPVPVPEPEKIILHEDEETGQIREVKKEVGHVNKRNKR